MEMSSAMKDKNRANWVVIEQDLRGSGLMDRLTAGIGYGPAQTRGISH